MIMKNVLFDEGNEFFKRRRRQEILRAVCSLQNLGPSNPFFFCAENLELTEDNLVRMNVSSWNLGDSNWGPSIKYVIIFYILIDPSFTNAL